MVTRKEPFDLQTNSPCQHPRKFIENSVENMHTDVGCKGLREEKVKGSCRELN